MADSKQVHWRNVIARANPDYLYAEDIGPSGSHIDVEVIDSGEGTVKNPDGSKRVVWLAFSGARKKLGCSATLCKTMTALCGTPDYREWRGWIRLAVITGKFRDPSTGETGPMDVIRIAAQRPPPRPRKESRAGAPPTQGSSTTPTPEEQAEIARLENQSHRKPE